MLPGARSRVELPVGDVHEGEEPGPIPPAWQGSRQAGEQPGHPSAPLPDTPGLVLTHQVWDPSGTSASQGPEPGRDGTRLGTASPTTWMGTVPKG